RSVVDDYPIANADVNSTNEDTPIVGATVVTNDVPSGDGGNVYNNACVVCTTTTNGALTFNPDGTYDYVPNPNYNGTDSFIYELCDVDGDCDTALVIITILPVNDAPVALDDAGLTFEDIPLTIDVQSNDSDPENDVLTTGVVVQPLHGTAVVVNTDSITYFPAPDFNGQDTFEYAICDPGGLCDTGMVIFTVIPVNDAPIANADVNSTNEDTPIVGAMVVTNDIPSGDGGNVYNNACVVCTTTSQGALTFNPDGTYDYVPIPNDNRTDSSIYEHV